MRCEVGAEPLREHHHGALRRGVRRDRRAGELRLDAADLDELARASGDHARGDPPRDVEHAREVRLHDVVPVAVGELGDRRPALDPRVVHHDVGRAELALDPSDARVDGRRVDEVEGRARHGRAGRCADLRRGALGLRGVATVHDHGRARARQPFGERTADALAGAGDERDPAGQVERGDAGHHCTARIARVVASTSSPLSRLETFTASSRRVRSRRSVSGTRNVEAVVMRARTSM